MNNLNDAVSRIISYYNITNPSLGVKGVAGQYIVSQGQNIYQDTAACFVVEIDPDWSPGRKVITDEEVYESSNLPDSIYISSTSGDAYAATPQPVEPVTVYRYEPKIKIRTVFTGQNALINSQFHYQRISAYLQQFGDMSLRNWSKFTKATIFWEAEYLIRYQSDATYLVYLDYMTPEQYLNQIQELLKAYPDQSLNNLLTSRTINIEETQNV